ncbi:hypothetical protein [Tahibacter harae]|uniref:CBM-cenC domain-containing protein n=1 Tax=Tahibacter harae TaxID=2963937 RepID=A0ABT1QMR8_9GAMM|nr:hypothetical protein [Tahibacter harae]MCQ4163325.1 hypothetical protein [Tahibacter harae]
MDFGRNTPVIRRALLAGLTAALASAPAAAQNLLGNPGFGGGLDSWSDYGSQELSNGQRNYTGADVAGVAGSGSAQFLLSAKAGNGVAIGLSQCFAVVPSQSYNYGARVLLPTGQPTGQARVHIEVAFYSAPACEASLGTGGSQSLLIGTDFPLDDSAWRGLPAGVPGTPASLVSPKTAASAQLRVYLMRDNAAGGAMANVDNVFFGVNLTPVALQRFSVD